MKSLQLNPEPKQDSGLNLVQEPDGAPSGRDGFMANLRQALEHVNDAEWLKANSPLESAALHTSPGAGSAPHGMPKLGIKGLDERLNTIWQDWESRPKTGLQALLWTLVRQIGPSKDTNLAALLLLTYFQDPRPKQGDLIKQLALGQSTFYRQLNVAVQAIEHLLVTQLQPSLRLEAPLVKALVGRDDVLQLCLTALRSGAVVNLIGGSGFGKTSLGAAVAGEWRARKGAVLWHTFRPGLSDTVEQLIFTVALFLHQHGASNLWLHLITHPQDVGPGKALAMIRKSLELLHAQPPLFCFDETDLLLPNTFNELAEDEEHARLRAWLEEFTESSRSGAPILFIGQRLLIEPQQSHVFALTRFGLDETQTLFAQAGIELNAPARQAALSYTRGNPLLLQLLLTLHKVGEPVFAGLPDLASSVSLDWFLARLRRHLSAKEQELLEAVCVFDSPAPGDLWRRQTKLINRLVELNLLEWDAADHVSMTQALREAFYRQLPDDAREGLHLEAAQAYAERGANTLAAHHFVRGQQAQMAVWTWHAHRDEECRQGQAHTALRLFEPLRFAAWADEKDRRMLALVLAELYHLVGKQDEGLAVLDTAQWPVHSASTARAKELRGNLLAQRGDIQTALNEYRAGLDAWESLDFLRPVTLHVRMARHSLIRMRDGTTARHEALLARHNVEIALGEIEEEAGHLDAAHTHFQTAIEAARQVNEPVSLAKAHESMGRLEARRLHVDAAQVYLEEAGRHYASYGNVICAVGVTNTNMSYANLLARRYVDAVAPAQAAISFFKDMDQPYWLSLNEANLAEAYAHLGRPEEAESLCWRALAHEEAVVRPYCLYVLGDVRRQQGQWSAAEQLCREALASAEANADGLALGPAWTVLGEVYADWRRFADARAAFEAACRVYEQAGVPEEVAWLQVRLGELV